MLKSSIIIIISSNSTLHNMRSFIETLRRVGHLRLYFSKMSSSFREKSSSTRRGTKTHTKRPAPAVYMGQRWTMISHSFRFNSIQSDYEIPIIKQQLSKFSPIFKLQWSKFNSIQISKFSMIIKTSNRLNPIDKKNYNTSNFSIRFKYKIQYN